MEKFGNWAKASLGGQCAGILTGAMQPLFPCVPNAVAGPNVLTLLVMLCTILGCNFIATFNTASLGASLWHLAPFYFHANKDSRSGAMK